MKNLLIGLVFGVIGGGGAGVALGIVLFPYLFPPPELNEQVVGKSTNEIVARAEFVHADPTDPIHYGRGSATVYADLVHLEADFEVGPGPKFHVLLVPDRHVSPATEVEATMFVDLGRLKAFSGSQNYPIPAGIDLNNFGSLVIWCEQFNVLISPAILALERR